MKKGISVAVICLLAMMFLGCGGSVLSNIHHNKKADDAISRAIYEAVGAKEIYYEEKRVSAETNRIDYYYYLNKEKEGVVEEAIEAVNKVLGQENADDIIAIRFCVNIPGGTEAVFCLCNFSDYNSTYAEYETLQCLRIYGTTHSFQDSIYDDPQNYQNFQGIRYLWVDEKIQKAADEAGIDWYEYWPELEAVEVYSPKN